MKQMSLRAIVMLIISGVFLAGLIVFCCFYVTDASDWALYPANTHLFNDGQISRAGKITDRNGTVLAQTVDGRRIYHDSRSIRKATLHAVGDLDGFIKTGLQSQYLGALCDYNLIDGVYQLQDTGNDLQTTLDADVCATALEGLGNDAGTVGVYNYKTGEVICMVSTPTYDIEDADDVQKAKDGAYAGVYINRFLSATYTPGSTFKIITAAAGIDTFSDIYEREYVCQGGVEIDGEWVSCMGYHGTQTLTEAFAHSCNAYFSQLAVDVGQQKLDDFAQKAGFNQSFSMDGISAATSFFDISATRDIDLAWAGMGQFTNMMNPLQYITMLGGIANGGSTPNPYMVESITSPMGIPLHMNLFRGSTTVFDSKICAEVTELMRNAVKNNYGTWRFPGLDVCAKSGTAEVGEDQTPHSVFVGFTTDEDLPLAFVVLVEHGGAGSSRACNIAASVLQSAREHVVF